MNQLPAFTEDGLLPAGDYVLTIDELKTSMLVLGPGEPKDHATWDSPWRERLLSNLAILVDQLQTVGINDVYINGSFVENKDHPNDIDGYFVCDLHRLASGELERDLNLLDPHKIWTWDPASRRPYRGYPKGSCQCGINTELSFTRTMGNHVASGINMGKSWSFPRRSANRGVMESQRALFGSEVDHDSQ